MSSDVHLKFLLGGVKNKIERKTPLRNGRTIELELELELELGF